MKLAGADFLIWIIIFLVVSAVQGWKKLQGDGDEDEPSEPAPPPVPRPRAARPPRPVAPPPVMPRAATSPPPKTWQVDPNELERLRRKFEPVPVVEAVAPAPPPVPEAPRPVAIPRKIKLAPVPGAGLAARLRRRETVRQAVIAAEILGPPKGAAY
jgi:hypothetical protein